MVRKTLSRVTGVTGSRLDALTVATFADFAMCFSDLVSTNRQPAGRLTSTVGRVEGVERVTRLGAPLISLTAHVGNWELAGRLLAGRAARTTHVVVAVQGDRALGTRGDVLIPFFGWPAPFPLGPFLLASAVGVPLVPAFCLLDADHRYAVKVAEPFAVPRGGEEEAARAWVAVLEDVVREYPTQWFNFFDIWSPVPA